MVEQVFNLLGMTEQVENLLYRVLPLQSRLDHVDGKLRAVAHVVVVVGLNGTFQGRQTFGGTK